MKTGPTPGQRRPRGQACAADGTTSAQLRKKQP